MVVQHSRWSMAQGITRRSALSKAGVAGLGAALIAQAGTARAADATPPAGAMAHPIVGAWVAITDVTDPNNNQSVFLFHPDGTYSEADANGTAGYGVWEATGANSANLTIHTNQTDEKGAYQGYITVRAAIDVAADGQSFTAQYTLDFHLMDGTDTGQYGPGTASGTRITSEAMGTPKGTLKDLFALLTPPSAATATP